MGVARFPHGCELTLFSLRFFQADLNRNYKSLRQKISLLSLMEVCSTPLLFCFVFIYKIIIYACNS